MEFLYDDQDEVAFEEGSLITEISLEGKITYVNRLFLQMSGYAKDELIGAPVSITRHPDMPTCCVSAMMDTVLRGETWEGYVKNLRKDGKYFWSVVLVNPKYDDTGSMIGFIAVRKPPGPLTLDEMKEKYARLLEQEQCRGENSELSEGFRIAEWA